MQMANNTTQHNTRDSPLSLFQGKNELPQVGFEPTTSRHVHEYNIITVQYTYTHVYTYMNISFNNAKYNS